MTLLELWKNGAGGEPTINTLADTGFHHPVNRADVWIDQMVETTQHAPSADIVTLTPALAKALLGRNDSNRRLREKVSDRYMRDILNDQFSFNGASVVISKTGKLLDGQHRCKAVMDGNQPILVVMVFGADDDARMTMDQGIARSTADFLSLDGHADAGALASAANMLWQFLKHGRVYRSGSMHPTKQDLRKIVAENPGLKDSLSVIPRKNADLVGGRSILAFCHYAIILKTGQRAEATQFVMSLVDGEGLAGNSPILYARNRLFAERGKSRTPEKLEVIFRTWNAHRRGETPSKLLVLGGPFPTLVA